MLFCRKVCVAFFLVCLVSVVRTDHHLNANGPFGKGHSVNDEPSPYSCHRGAGISPSPDPIRTMVNADLNVSATVYASLDQIQVTWLSTWTSCQDDFIGIYSTEIPIDTGMDTIAMFLVPFFFQVLVNISIMLLCKRMKVVCHGK